MGVRPTRRTPTDYRSALDEGTLRENVAEIPKFRILQFWGTYRGASKDGPIPDRLCQRFYYPDRESYPSSNEDVPAGDPDRQDVEDLDGTNYIDYPDPTSYAIDREDEAEADVTS